TCFSLPFGA
ncbi:hypothetical protein EC100833_3004, partial [Escherichia coli 10.0833]